MIHPTRRNVLQAAAASGLAAFAGCLPNYNAVGNEDEGGDGSLGDPASEVDVTVVSRPTPAFEPGIVHVEPGGTVRWVVEGHRHDVTAYHPDTYGPQRIPDDTDPWESGLLRGGREFEHTFTTEGVYDYVDTRALCATHEALGAVGRVVVGWPDPDGQPALEHDVDEMPGRSGTVLGQYNEDTLAVLRAD